MLRFIASALLLFTLSGAANSQNFFDFFRQNGPNQTYRPEPRYQTRQQDPTLLRTIVSYPGLDKGKIVISPEQRRLYLGLGGGRALRYAIGVGKEGMLWHGVMHVGAKKEWPSWTPTPEMRVRVRNEQNRVLPVTMPGGIDNPLGERALYLFGSYVERGVMKNAAGGDSLFRIHGTNEPHTIGQSVSSGCFRMTNDDVVDLYARVPLGAEVEVLEE